MNGFAPLIKKEADMEEFEIVNLLQIHMVASKIIAISWDFRCEICKSWSFFSEVKKNYYQQRHVVLEYLKTR